MSFASFALPLLVCCLVILQAQRQVVAKTDDSGHQYYFYNEVTGDVQWEDPGDVPFEDEGGVRYWILPNGQKALDDPAHYKYAWIEQFSEEAKRPFFFNQETRESIWERPADLAWRRIRVHDD